MIKMQATGSLVAHAEHFKLNVSVGPDRQSVVPPNSFIFLKKLK